MIYAHFFCRENNLRTSSGKFLRVEFCHSESSDFLGLWTKETQHVSRRGVLCLIFLMMRYFQRMQFLGEKMKLKIAINLLKFATDSDDHVYPE